MSIKCDEYLDYNYYQNLCQLPYATNKQFTSLNADSLG